MWHDAGVAWIPFHRHSPFINPRNSTPMIIPAPFKYGLVCLLVFFLAPAATSQGTIWITTGLNNYDFFGTSIDQIGDVNGDGIPDVISGSDGISPNGQESGQVRVVSGADGPTLMTFDGDSANDQFGYQVSRCGDVNGDGIDDWSAASPLDDNNGGASGMVRVFAGGTVSIIYQFDGAASDDVLGKSLGYLGDVNGDGRADILVGAPQKNYAISGASTQPGYVTVYSGATGTALYSVSGNVANDQFGDSCAGGQDLNGDGVNDFIVGAYGEDTNGTNAGSVSAHSGVDGSVIWTAYGDGARDHMGASLAIIGDVNGDGIHDVAAGAPEDDNNGSNSGSVHVLSGADGSKITVIDGAANLDQMGSSVSSFGDINGDGIEEFLAGASLHDGGFGTDSGKLYVIDGATLVSIMYVEGGLAGDRMGWDCAGGMDYDADGIPDFIAGCVQYFAGGGNNGRGYVSLHDTTGTPPPPPPTWPNLPSSFVSTVPNGYNEDFEALAGVVPPHMAINELDMFFRTLDPDAWCNIGQNAPCISANSGTYCLEMGGDPLMSGHHEVANGLVIGIDGAGSNHLVVDFAGINWGEENQADDGIWVSDNGTDWYPVQVYWNNFAAVGVWEQFNSIDLTSTVVDTTTQFYLLFAQADNYEYGSADGIGIDDISVHDWTAPGPELSLTPFPPVSGAPAVLNIANNNPGDLVASGYSFVGAGPTQTAYGTLLLSPPFTQFPNLIANASGNATMTANVPPVVQGWDVWLHALNFTQMVWTNPLATTFQ